MEAKDDTDEGMPIMFKELVLIKAVRLRTCEGSYLLAHEDRQNVKLLNLQATNTQVPKAAEWQVIRSSGEAGTCSFVSIYNKVLTVGGFFYQTPYIERRPVLDGAGDWLLEIVNKSCDSKTFQAKLRPARSWNRLLSLDVLKGFVMLCSIGETLFFSLRGWTVEVVRSSPVSEVNKNNSQKSELGFQLGHDLENITPGVLQVVNVNHGIIVSKSQIAVGGGNSNSGYNENDSGTQNSGACVTK